MTNQFDLTGRTAVVTGSAQGMGCAMATALAEAGADVVLLDRNEAGNEATAHSIRQIGRKALPIAGDVTDPIISTGCSPLWTASSGGWTSWAT
jgi:NAD(P)-dependent dehydrogenase (short-subunit alcohol dehydrogenase family)